MYTHNQVAIQDKLKIFISDKQAAQYERGTQIGGHYKYGGCGCKDSLMDDQAHALRCEWRSLEDLQAAEVAGKFGRQPLVLKTTQYLTVNLCMM